jgi:molecular chaperone IbpA
MTKNQLSIFNRLRPVTVGYDNVFDHFERMFDDDFFMNSVPSVNYPPYNIVKTGEYTYNVEVALAGFSRDDINVEYADGMLTIKSKDKKESEETDKDGAVIHKGISKRYFSKCRGIGSRAKRRLTKSVFGENCTRAQKSKTDRNQVIDFVKDRAVIRPPYFNRHIL